MSISTVLQTNSLPAQASTNSIKQSTAEIPSTQKQQNYQETYVTISDASRKASALESNSSSTGLDDLRLPSWLADYLPKANNLSDSHAAIKESVKYQQLNATARSNGVVSEIEQKAIDTYRSNMTSTELMREKMEFQQQFSRELDEYGQYVNEAFASAKSDAGVSTNQDYIDNLLNNADASQAIHDDFQSKLFSNPRAVELMKFLV